MATSANSRVAGWRLEDIDDNLAADFDGSLSGLGVDLSVASYNMRSVCKIVYFWEKVASPSRLVHYRHPLARLKEANRLPTTLFQTSAIQLFDSCFHFLFKRPSFHTASRNCSARFYKLQRFI